MPTVTAVNLTAEGEMMQQSLNVLVSLYQQVVAVSV